MKSLKKQKVYKKKNHGGYWNPNPLKPWLPSYVSEAYREE
jgi:hypothetical protein